MFHFLEGLILLLKIRLYIALFYFSGTYVFLKHLKKIKHINKTALTNSDMAHYLRVILLLSTMFPIMTAITITATVIDPPNIAKYSVPLKYEYQT